MSVPINSSAPTARVQTFPVDVIAQLRQSGTERHFAKGQHLFLRGDAGDFVVILNKGLVEISVTSLAGRTSVLAHLGAGEIIGEISALDGRPRSADAVALRPCETIVVSRQVLQDIITRHPDGTDWIIRALCDRVRNASGMFETAATLSAPSRLARCLLQLVGKWGVAEGDVLRISETFSQSELGAFAGVARENVNRLVRTWSLDDKIRFDRGRIEVLDLTWLEALAEEDEASPL